MEGAGRLLKSHITRRSFGRNLRFASFAPHSFNVSAPSEAWCTLQGESPCRVRANHPPVSSVALVAEFEDRNELSRLEGTPGNWTNKTGEAYTEKCVGHRDYRDPEVLASPRKKHLFRLTRVVTYSKSKQSIRVGEDVESRRGSQAVACA